jgi:DNA-binding CsgD family transcriptional regulator
MVNPFFDKTLNFTSIPSYKNLHSSVSTLIVGAMNLRAAFLLIDQYKRSITFYSQNPNMTYLFGEVEEKTLDDESIEKLFSTDNGHFYSQIIETANEIFKGDILGNNNRTYSLSYNCSTLRPDGTAYMLKLKMFVLKYTDYSSNGIPWLIYYKIEETEEKLSGNFQLLDIIGNQEYSIFINTDYSHKDKYELLTNEEVRILQLSSDGLTEQEIVDRLESNMNTLKNIKTNLLARLNAKSITHAIFKVKKQGFI